ncbi:DUF58 domain-containing protein [Candidatus Sumerlaeota bacterium]|nr:DUF58 domain-containing protein [Candidatus Sumerlaeota bacterium]
MPHFLTAPFIYLYRLVKRWFEVRREYRITLEGIVFILITFFIGFAAINTNTNLLYLILSMMLSLFILSGLLSSATLRKISVKRLAARHISAKETATVQMELRNNKKRLSSYSLRIMDFMENGDIVGAGYHFHIAPRSREIVSYKVKFPHRGVYKLSRIRVASRFPFGFFERAILIRQSQEILVYPQILDVRPILEAAKVDLGEYETGKKGHGHSLYGIREYTPTDSARYIHWKVSARSSKIMLREFEKEEKKKVTILLRNAIPGPFSAAVRESFEKAVIFAASISKFLIDREFQTQLVTGSGTAPFGLGIAHLYRILRALAVIQLEEKTDSHEPALSYMDADSTNLIIHFDYRITPPPESDYAQVINVLTARL